MGALFSSSGHELAICTLLMLRQRNLTRLEIKLLKAYAYCTSQCDSSDVPYNALIVAVDDVPRVLTSVVTLHVCASRFGVRFGVSLSGGELSALQPAVYGTRRSSVKLKIFDLLRYLQNENNLNDREL
jgi:hypothetical protein